MRSSADVSNLDYASVREIFSIFVISQCVEPLLALDDKLQPRGLLAESWENPDERTYIFKLRRGVKLQDGSDLNADAVEYSRKRASAAAPSDQGTVNVVEKVEKPDQSTVKMTLTRPDAPFLAGMANYPAYVISPALAEKYGNDKLKVDLTDLGTGPFKFVEWKKDDHVTLVRNETYWGKDAAGAQLPNLNKLVVRTIPDWNQALASLRSGEVDAFRPSEGPPAKDAVTVKADPSLSYKSIPSLGFWYVAFNEAKEPFNSRELRQALSYAIDREAIVKAALFDTVSPLDVIFAPSSPAHDPNYHPYLKRDVGKAKQLLAQAGRPNGFSFTLATVGGPVPELIQDQLKEAGIAMTIQQFDVPKMNQVLNASEHQAALTNWSGGVSPNDQVFPLFHSRGQRNAYSRYQNAQVDALLEQARGTLDPARSKPLYQQAQRLIMDDAVYCMLYTSNFASLTSHNVRNYPLPLLLAGRSVSLSNVWKTG